MRNISDRLAGYFLVQGLKWGEGEKAFIPTAEDFEKALDVIVSEMVDYPDETQYEVGRLIVTKRGGHLDVYVHAGDLNGEDNVKDS